MNIDIGLRCLSITTVAALAAGQALAYDPLAVPGKAAVSTQDFAIRDDTRHREIPVRVYLPADTKPAPVVLFSHGLGGSRAGSAYLGQHWAARGYAVVYIQHPGSDTAVWQDEPGGQRLAAMHQAASLKNFRLRVQDVAAVLDQLTAWNTTAGHPLAGRFDLTRIGMSGHSFGAMTTEAVSGETLALVGTRYTDPRIKAAIAFSPSSQRSGNARKAFASVKIPWLLMTGTKDVALIGQADVASRRAVYAALPPGGKYELVLDRAEHSAFTDRALPGDTEPRNPNHHRAILAISTAFWDAWLCGNADARAWLDGAGPRSVLESKDEWQRK
ncbi:MAG TPA: dienelactone hydrolase [Verrucomicrobiae bacterium]|nr:dienelactone hydrolase [Verrucomicrobiae bacterium]